MSGEATATTSAVDAALGGWLTRYREAHRDELANDEVFARWLEEDYAPIAGGWHY